MNVSMVILGRGECAYESALSRLGRFYPGKIAVNIGYNDSIAHRILAGANMFLAPSLYEPCGLAHLYALRFGAVPVVRATGGLDDTVVQFNQRTGKGTGFKFIDYKARAFLYSIKQAVKTFKDLATWQGIVKNGMNADFSWERSARKYKAIYENTCRGKKAADHVSDHCGRLHSS